MGIISVAKETLESEKKQEEAMIHSADENRRKGKKEGLFQRGLVVYCTCVGRDRREPRAVMMQR